MRCVVCGLAIVAFCGGVALGQDKLSYEELQKRYDDARKQLDMAQARKNELSKTNEELKAKLAEVEHQLADFRARHEALSREAAGWGERTHFLRNHYAAWRQYMGQFPSLWAHWEIFLEGKSLAPPGDVAGLLAARPPAPLNLTPSTRPATTAPTSQPADK